MAVTSLLVCYALTVGAWGAGDGRPFWEGPAPAHAATAAARRSAIGRGLDYMHACQNEDGGFGEKGQRSSEFLTSWAVVAIAAAGEDPSTWGKGDDDPVGYLAGKARAVRGTADLARMIIAVSAARKDPRSFGGIDLVAKLKDDVSADGDKGDHIGALVNTHIWGMLALAGADSGVTSQMTRWLLAQQNGDGGWGWGENVASDSNDTAAAIQALIAAGQSPSSSAVRRAVSYLKARQGGDSGFTYGGGASDANSTSWCVQALAAAGEPFESDAYEKRGLTPTDFLRVLQRSDGGFAYQKGQSSNPLFVTVQAIPALAWRPFPLGKDGGFGSASRWVPVARLVAPAHGGTVAAGRRFVIRLSVSDGKGTGVAPAGLVLRLDGKRLAPTISSSQARVSAPALAKGSHRLEVRVVDRAGNAGRTSTYRFAAATASSTRAAPAGSAAPGGMAVPQAAAPTQTVAPGVSAVGVSGTQESVSATTGAAAGAAALASGASTAATSGVPIPGAQGALGQDLAARGIGVAADGALASDGGGLRLDPLGRLQEATGIPRGVSIVGLSAGTGGLAAAALGLVGAWIARRRSG